MVCNRCGVQNLDNAVQCSSCGGTLQPAPAATAPQPGPQPAPAQNVPNYLVQSILVTLFCCLPFGIAAIVFASQVNGKLQAGDTQGAMDSAAKAKMWCWVSFGLGLAGQLIYFVLAFIGGMAEAM